MVAVSFIGGGNWRKPPTVFNSPNIRFLPSIVAEKNATKNAHICSMCIKINKVGKQEVGIWWVQKRFHLRFQDDIVIP
jgi:hypothetical protein